MDRRAFEFSLLVLSVSAALGLIAYLAWVGRGIAADAEMGFHGVAAMLLGVLLTLALTALLVGLLLYSRRHGYDQSGPEDSDT